MSFFLCVHTRVTSCPGVGYHQQSTAFNARDERKINIVPMKMISSPPFITSHFHQFAVWERIYGSSERERGKKFELLQHCVNISLSSFLPLFFPLTTAVHSKLHLSIRTSASQTVMQFMEIYICELFPVGKRGRVNCNALTNIMLCVKR